jgi:hypothetical protein
LKGYEFPIVWSIVISKVNTGTTRSEGPKSSTPLAPLPLRALQGNPTAPKGAVWTTLGTTGLKIDFMMSDLQQLIKGDSGKLFTL